MFRHRFFAIKTFFYLITHRMKHVSLLIVLIFVSIQGFGQHLTISTSGETGTSGTNWSITGNVLQIASSGTAAIHPSVITNHLTNTGNLVVDLPFVNVLRNIYINDHINYTGSNARTLIFKSAIDIIVANGVSISANNASLNLVLRSAIAPGYRGVITMNASTINTNGGHFWAGGGTVDVSWNSLTVGNEYARTWTSNEIGLSMVGGSLTTNGGNIEMKGMSFNSAINSGNNIGLKLDNTTISSGSGSIKIDGNLNGKFTNGIACSIEALTGPISILSTSGSINLSGNGWDAVGTASGWRHGILLSGTTNHGVSVKSTSGSILIEGTATYNNNTTNDCEGVALFASTTDRLKITSQSGTISIKGNNSKENLGQYSNAIRFGPGNATNALRIGYDGVTAYNGTILIEGNSIYQRSTHAGSGSIAIQTTGGLTIQPSGTSFTYMRAGDNLAGATLTYDDDWNFGTNISSFTFGKTGTISDLTFTNVLTVAGSTTINAGILTLNSSLSSTVTSGPGISLNALKIIHSAGITITTQGGNIAYSALNSPFTASDDRGILFSGTIGSKAIVNANGGNISLNAVTAPTGVLGGSDRVIACDYTDILTNGSGSITMVGDATNSTNTTNAWGFQLSTTLIQTNSGAISITGTGGKATLNSRGIVTDVSSLKLLSNSGTITLTDIKPIGLTGNYYGIYLNPSASSDINIGADGTNIVNSSSSVSIISDKAALRLNSGKNVKINTSGSVVVESLNASFDYIEFTGLSIAGNPSSVRIGKATNTLSVALAGGITAGGPISIYGSSISLNDNISSSSNGDILLTGNTLSIAAGKTISSGGKLLLQTQTASTTIGIAGATGSLQLPATYFTTNFTDGFSSIQIGSSLQTGAISMNGFTLQDPIHFQTSGNLALGGLPILGNNSVTLNAGIASITGTPTNYFKTTGTGKVIRTISNASTFEFPIGRSSYNPLSITNNTGASDEFFANVMDALYVNGVSGTAVSSTAVNRTWDISKTNANAGSGVDFVFNWNAGDVANGSFYLPELNHFSGSAWEVPVVSSSTVGTNALTVVGYTGTFSPFSIQEGSGLPIELTLFNSNCSEIGTTINWQTASEHHSASFDVEKSRDGNNWSLLESIQAAGNSTTLVDYKVVDSEKATDVVYYRLNQIDLNGESKTFGPISANCIEIIDFKATVFPNPAAGMVTVEMNTPIAQTVSIQICGTDGKAIMQTTNKLEQGTTQIPLSVERLKAGVYTVKVYGENTMKTIKLIVQ